MDDAAMAPECALSPNDVELFTPVESNIPYSIQGAAPDETPVPQADVGAAAARQVDDDGSFAPAVPPGFRLTEDGVEKLFTDKNGEEHWRWFCSPVAILAHTRDFSSAGWSLLVEVTDFDGTRHRVTLPRAALGDGNALRDRLSPLGLQLLASAPARAALAEYLSMARPHHRVRFVTRIGWHSGVFVLPDETIGVADRERVILEGSRGDHHFHVAGTLEDWQRNVARLAVSNSRLVLVLCVAMAAALLDVVGAESGGVHLVGPSSCRKSTALLVAGSFHGGGGMRGNVHSWRTTDNALEARARLHCDACLNLDEVAEMEARSLAAAVYMVAHGAGRSRATREGGPRPVAEWRLTFNSTGEISLAAKLAEAGQSVKAGHLTRFIDIPADPGAGHGLYEELHGFQSGAALSKHLKDASTRHYGAAGRAYLHHVVENRQAVAELARRYMGEFVNAYCPPGADGQVVRVAERFALYAAAGELAAHAGVVPWAPQEATRGIATAFRDWLGARGGLGSAEMLMAIDQVLERLQRHSTENFDLWRRAPGGDMVDERARDRLGFRRTERGTTEYYVSAAGFRALCSGYDTRAVADELHRRGLLVRGKDGKNSVLATIPGQPKARYYHLTPGEQAVADAEVGDVR
jgi:uncharacterized protein (DUF927 family)